MGLRALGVAAEFEAAVAIGAFDPALVAGAQIDAGMAQGAAVAMNLGGGRGDDFRRFHGYIVYLTPKIGR